MQSKDFDSVKPYVYWIKNLETGNKYALAILIINHH